MLIEQVRVQKYKSINDSAYIKLSDRFSVIAGKNNVGKTALLEVIYFAFKRGLTNPMANLENYNDLVYVDIILSFDNNDQEELKYYNPNFIGRYLLLKLITSASWNQTGILEVYRVDKHNDEIILPGFPLCIWDFRQGAYRSKDYENNDINREVINSNIPNFIHEVYNIVSQRVIFIRGNRSVPVNQTISDYNVTLDISASNFYSFMFYLHNNQEEIFDEIQETFIKIFSDVSRVSTNVTSNYTNIHLDFDHIKSIPLHECGTGFIHVLIMLCVLYTDKQRFILFDEPHSFLHPSAEKALYDLAFDHKTHQFVFTTHSPLLINYPKEKSLYLVTKNKGVTQFNSFTDIQEVFENIGIKNSDYAFSDKIIFVEGQTEEEILPLILEHYGIKQLGYNFRILNLEGKGKVYGKKRTMNKTSFLLDKIFTNITINPIPYIILLDSDGKDASHLKEVYEDKVVVLNRYEIENYFLIPEALKAVLEENKICLSLDEISQLIKTHEENSDVVKGSNILEEIFDKYGLEYNKIYHGKKLASWLLNNNNDELREIVQQLCPFFEKL